MRRFRSPAASSEHPRGHSPFAPIAPSIITAVVFAVATFVWVAAGDALPGGRWLAVHLFTLGVLTNLVLAFSEHFSRTLTRTPGERAPWWVVVTNVAILTVIIGRAVNNRMVLVVGSVVLVAVVCFAYYRLRRMRRGALGARFTWVVRVYEHSHGAFILGAVLGVLLGAGVLTGSWYPAGRTAHLHINLLGWGGLTLLATLVFFGPTMARARIVPGADARAARALRYGAAGLTSGVLLLLATGFGGPAGTTARLLGAVGLAVFASAATVVCIPVIGAARRAKPTAARLPLIGLCAWFIAVVWLDVVVVATGAWRFLDALGVVLLVGVLGQAIAVVLTYVTPMLRGRSLAVRNRIGARFERGARVRAVAYNLAVVVLLGATAVGGQLGATRTGLVVAGWAIVGATTVQQLLVAMWALPKTAQPLTD